MSELLDWKGKDLLILDGGFATELERQGADLSGHLWSARILRDSPALIQKTHELYYAAGADIGITASYQATIAGFERIGLDKEKGIEMLRSSVHLAQQAREASWKLINDAGNVNNRRRPLVAASVGCYGASLADGSEYRGDYGLTIDDLKSFHRRRLLYLAAEKPDLLACETIPCLLEVQAILELLVEPEIRKEGIPAWISVSCRDSGYLNSGEAIEELLHLVNTKRCDLLIAVGVNCSSPHHVEGALQSLAKTQLPLVVYANTGEDWDGEKHAWKPGTAVDDATFCTLATKWQAAGARIIGGCCRTTPQTIQALRATLLPKAD